MAQPTPSLFKNMFGTSSSTEFALGFTYEDVEGLIVMFPLVFGFLMFSIALQAMDRPFEPWQAQFDGEDNQSE